MAKKATDFPIGSKVLYSAYPCDGYESQHGKAGAVVGYGSSATFCEVNFGHHADPWPCYPEELTLIEDPDGQYRMEF